jgi:uncharacterized SAM-binding protein YcdF (DUF218 family)
MCKLSNIKIQLNILYLSGAGEDREFCDRWLYHGYKMQYVPDAIILHSHYLTWSSFCKQHLNYGRGAFH